MPVSRESPDHGSARQFTWNGCAQERAALDRSGPSARWRRRGCHVGNPLDSKGEPVGSDYRGLTCPLYSWTLRPCAGRRHDGVHEPESESKGLPEQRRHL